MLNAPVEAASAPAANSSESPGQERRHDQPGLREDDQEEQRVHPHAVGLDELREVRVEVEKQIDQCFHRSDSTANTSRYFNAPPVLNSTTVSSASRGPRRSACLSACSAAPPSGAALMPSRLPSSRIAATMSASRHGERGAAALAHGAQHQEIADRLRHAQAVGDGPRVLPHLGPLGALLEGADDRRAVLGLHRDHPRALAGALPADRSSSSNAFHMPTMPVPPPVG